MGILITAFEPFGGDTGNTSATLLRAIASDSDSARYNISTRLLPVAYPAALDELLAAIEVTQPHTVICLGQDNSRGLISVEKVAINFCDFNIPDNSGKQPRDEAVVVGAPVAYFSTLPVGDLVQCMTSTGARTQVSYSAGAYVCNALFYGLMHYIDENSLPIRAGFVHLPGGHRGEANDGGVQVTVDAQFAALKQVLKFLSKGSHSS